MAYASQTARSGHTRMAAHQPGTTDGQPRRMRLFVAAASGMVRSPPEFQDAACFSRLYAEMLVHIGERFNIVADDGVRPIYITAIYCLPIYIGPIYS